MLKLIALFILLNVSTIGNSFADTKGTIYIDPSVGEDGPVASEQRTSHETALAIADKLKSLLEKNGFTVYLPKADKSPVPVEARLLQARQLNADIYLSLRTSKKVENCIRLYYASQKYVDYEITEQNRGKMKPAELDEILSSVKKKYITKESTRLSEILSRHLEAKRVPQCGHAKTTSDYILDNTFCPTVIINYGSASTEAVSGVIAESVQEYFATSTRKPASRSKQPENLSGPPP